MGFSKTKADNLRSGPSAAAANVTEVRCVIRQNFVTFAGSETDEM